MFPFGDCRAGLYDEGYQELQLLLYVPCGTEYMLIQHESTIKYGVPETRNPETHFTFTIHERNIDFKRFHFVVP